MIKINIDVSKNIALKKAIGESIHMSLIGSPAYINNEILLNVDEDPNNIILIVGEDNNNDTELDVELSSVSKISEKEKNKSEDESADFSKKIETLLNYTFSSIGDKISAPQEYMSSLISHEPLRSGCFEDKDSRWVQKFFVISDKDLEAAIDKRLSEFMIMDVSHLQSTNMIGYTKIKDTNKTIYVFVISMSKDMLNANFKSMHARLYLLMQRVLSSLPNEFFTNPIDYNIE